MNAFKTIGKSIVSSVTGKGDGKIAPDDVLVSCREQLVSLRDEITLVRSQFTQYAEQMSASCEAGVELSKIVSNFYKDNDHNGRSKSIFNFLKAQESMANDCFHLIQNEISNENGVCSELDEWLEAIKQITSLIEDAERARLAAMTTETRLESLEDQYLRKKKQNSNNNNNNNNHNSSGMSKNNSIFAGLTHSSEQDLEDLSNKINETKKVKESLSKDFIDARNKVSKQVNTIVNQKYVIMDKIYVDILESQYSYFLAANKVTNGFFKSIKYYRKQFPKNNITPMVNVGIHSNENSHSFGSLHGSLHGSRHGSQGSFGSLNQSFIAQQSSHSPKKQNEKIENKKARYQSVTDLLDFATNNNNNNNNNNSDNNNNRSKNDASKNDASKNDASKNDINKTNKSNNNNNDSDNIGNNGKINNSINNNSNDSGVNKSEKNNIDNNSNGNNNNNNRKLEKQNSFDLMAGFSSSDAKQFSQLKHIGKQESYLDVWGTLVTASQSPELGNLATGVTLQSLFPDPNSSKEKKIENNNNNSKKEDIILSGKEKERANKVAYERYLEIQKQFDKEDLEREERQLAFDRHGERIDLWEFDSKGQRRNLRTLLIKLPDVLWSDSGWITCNLSNLVNEQQCKKYYRKAVRLVHPDRSKNRMDSVERTAICERIFEALNSAWKEEFG